MTKKLEEILNLPNIKKTFAQIDAKEKTKQANDKIIGKSKNLDPETHKNLQKVMMNLIKLRLRYPR